MLIETIALGITFAQAWKANDLDNKSLKTLKKAYDTHANAIALFERHKQDADASLRKLVNRKKGILSTRMNRFVSVYQQIRKIDFRPGDGIWELYTNSLSVKQVEELETMAVTSMEIMSEKELAIKYLFTGAGGMILSDSKRNAEIANSQRRIANTIYSQAETLVIAVDAIGKRAEQMAGLLARFSMLFGESIKSTEQIIQQNGTVRDRYSRADRETLMNCINLAQAVKAILDVPILNADGSVTEASLAALEEGERRLQELQQNV